MNKVDLIRKIKDIDALTNEEKSELIELINTQKRYGLVWEDKPEEVEEELREKLPVLVEVKERAILAENLPDDAPEEKTGELFEEELEKPKAPNHILIEGDNLHALTVLNYTHAGKIDVIYIDPPYNTGAKDWKYNNDYVDKEDAFKHSKWISFIHKRLNLARGLLTEGGIIICAIDHNELFPLGVLMDEIFSEENRLGIVTVVHKPEGRNQEKFFGTSNEFALFYAKNKSQSEFNQIAIDDDIAEKFTENDERGKYRLKNFIRTADGKYATKEAKPNFYYPIYVSKDLQNISLQNDNNLIPVYPIIKSGIQRTWKTLPNTFLDNLNEGKITAKKEENNIIIYEKLYEAQVIKTHWIKKEYHAYHFGTKVIDGILGEKKFNFPKSIHLIEDILKLISKSNSIILDFFAGSGTTLHASMQLNKEDGGSRQCILVTNNENKIAEEVCYERNKRVIQGYTKPNGDKVAGLKNNNFRYYKTDYVGRDKTAKNRRKLTELATDMLCIKEDCYKSITNEELRITKGNIKLFENDSIFMMIILDEDYIEQSIEIIRGLEKKVKVYIFSPGQYPFTDDFEEVLDKVELCALPEAIYKAYKSILPKKKVNEYGENIEDTEKIVLEGK